MLRSTVTRPFCHGPPMTSQSQKICAQREHNAGSATLVAVVPEFTLTPGGPFGIYVHVPFCATRCGYCDFNTYTPGELGGTNPDGWLAALRIELALARAR